MEPSFCFCFSKITTSCGAAQKYGGAIQLCANPCMRMCCLLILLLKTRPWLHYCQSFSHHAPSKTRQLPGSRFHASCFFPTTRCVPAIHPLPPASSASSPLFSLATFSFLSVQARSHEPRLFSGGLGILPAPTKKESRSRIMPLDPTKSTKIKRKLKQK